MRTVTRKIVGVILIVLGLAALLTPLSPGSWLILVGLELLGLRILLEDKLLAWADTHPGSRAAKLICRVLRIRHRDTQARRRWRKNCPQ